jgi:hypothetical protein
MQNIPELDFNAARLFDGSCQDQNNIRIAKTPVQGWAWYIYKKETCPANKIAGQVLLIQNLQAPS